MESLGQAVLNFATTIAFGCLLVSFAFTVYRLLRGPSFADRVVALDFLMLIAIGFITLNAIVSNAYNFIDVAIAMALVGFLATTAFARYIYRRAKPDGVDPAEELDDGLEHEGAATPSPTPTPSPSGQGGQP